MTLIEVDRSPDLDRQPAGLIRELGERELQERVPFLEEREDQVEKRVVARREGRPPVARLPLRRDGGRPGLIEPPRGPVQARMVGTDGEPVAEEIDRTPPQLVLVLAHEPEGLRRLRLPEQRAHQQRTQRAALLVAPLELELVQELAHLSLASSA